VTYVVGTDRALTKVLPASVLEPLHVILSVDGLQRLMTRADYLDVRRQAGSSTGLADRAGQQAQRLLERRLGH
jgi:hypothetical protein